MAFDEISGIVGEYAFTELESFILEDIAGRFKACREKLSACWRHSEMLDIEEQKRLYPTSCIIHMTFTVEEILERVAIKEWIDCFSICTLITVKCQYNASSGMVQIQLEYQSCVRKMPIP